MAGVGQGVQGYICTPHRRESEYLLDHWKKSMNIVDIYFVTATFSDESQPYFPDLANHYVLASCLDINLAVEDIKKFYPEGLSFLFYLTSFLFERSTSRLNYVSLYFTKYSYGDMEIGDLANAIAKRERVKKASIVNMHVMATSPPKFVFPYSKNIFALEVEGENTHQSDQKYCERTRRDVARKGIPLSNLVSFSILEKLK